MTGELNALITAELAADPAVTVGSLVATAVDAHPHLARHVVEDEVMRALERARGFGAIGPLLVETGVTEVMVLGSGEVFVERQGRIEAAGVRLGSVDVAVLIERILQPLGLRVDRLSPCADARLPDGARVNIVVPPVSIDGPVVTIRRFSPTARRLADFGPPAVAELLRRLVTGRATILVVGGTGAGKTTLLNALGAEIDAHERIVTIEDTAELDLPGEHVVRLEARNANSEGAGAVSIRDLVRNSLRMRPDRLLVGEVRSGEAFDLLMALNTGHEGSLATCHANSPVAGLMRLETLALLGDVDVPLPAVRHQLLGAIDIVVHVVRNGGRRTIRSVAEVNPTDMATQELWPLLTGVPRRPAVVRSVRG